MKTFSVLNFDIEHQISSRSWSFRFGVRGFFGVFYWGFFCFPLKEFPSAGMGLSHWTCALSKFSKWVMSTEQGGRGRCSIITLPMLVPTYKEFFWRELGCMFCWAWIIVTYLVRRQWTFDYKSGIWNAGEEYHSDWVNSHGFNVGWRIFEVLCGHFSGSHIFQKLKYVSGFMYGSILPQMWPLWKAVHEFWKGLLYRRKIVD